MAQVLASPSCTLLKASFLAMLACVLLGNLLGALAWRHRRPELPRYQWLRSQTYLFRPSLYLTARQPLRIAAITSLGVGLILLLWLALTIARLLLGGETTICGFQF